MNTYYHYQGFVYGPWQYELPDSYDDKVADILSLPKYKWTGPPLEDWKEMIEGKDFKLDYLNPPGARAYYDSKIAVLIN